MLIDLLDFASWRGPFYSNMVGFRYTWAGLGKRSGKAGLKNHSGVGDEP